PYDHPPPGCANRNKRRCAARMPATWRLWKFKPAREDGKRRRAPNCGTAGWLDPNPPAWPPPPPPELATTPSDGSNMAAVTMAIAVPIDRWSMVRSLSPTRTPHRPGYTFLRLSQCGKSIALPRPHGALVRSKDASRRLPRQISEVREDAVARAAQGFHLFGELRIHEPAVALHHFAGDQHGVDIGDAALH